MIISHNSYTFQKPKNLFMRFLSCFWKTQKLDIKSQYDLGTRVFDIRVYQNKNEKWGTAHGLAKFNLSFSTISSICMYFKDNFPNSILRIYLEDNVKNSGKLDKAFKIKEKFLNEADEAFSKYKDMIWEIGTHHPWITYYRNNDFHPQIKEYYCHLFNWDTDKSVKYNLKNFDWTSWNLYLYAKKHNLQITQEMIDDKNTMYIMDYVGIYSNK